MKRFIFCILAFLLCLCLPGCGGTGSAAQIAATTLPVYDFTLQLCSGTPLQVERVISQEISCLHDYTLQVSQMQVIEGAQLLVLSGAGLEDGLLPEELKAQTIDASAGIDLICHDEEQDHEHEHEHGHTHAEDPHIWLSAKNARQMALNIYEGLRQSFPEHTELFRENLSSLEDKFNALEVYAQNNLRALSCRKLVTFHDGFSYMADAWNLELLHAVEEESGSEASARELAALCQLVTDHKLPAVFTEKSGSISAAAIISAETGIPTYSLDMAMSGESYFEAMYHNIDVLKEALG